MFISGYMAKTCGLRALRPYNGHSQLNEENKGRPVNSIEQANMIIKELREKQSHRKIYMTPPEIRSGPHFEWPHMPSYRHLWDPNWIE